MLRIRLTRVGKKNSPAYRVVVADQRKAVKRKFIEILGHYNPIMKPKELVIDKERALFWISQGAQPSDTVNNLMCDLEILPKKNRIATTLNKSIEVEKKADVAEEKKETPVAEETTTVEPEQEATETVETAEETVENPAEIEEKVESEVVAEPEKE
ncbi:MAG: 30S ribosomal protein S16 [Candidatus Berkelbacteria bacterium]|nr:30S ribosomal protein S16 [Candidatus Berkelbacteria bacterium]